MCCTTSKSSCEILAAADCGLTFSIDDLFLAGIGLDVAGAYLLGRGLLTEPATILRKATPYWNFSAPVALAQAEDRVDAIAGIVVLLVGFGLQALAYTVSIGFGLGPGRGWERAVTALSASVIVGATGLALAYATRWRRLRRFLIELARYGKTGHRHRNPSAARLQTFGFELGKSALEKEVLPGGPRLYAARVFGVLDTRDDSTEILE